MTTDIMSILSEAGFAASKASDRPRPFNRFMGGHARTNHPYISGYWYFFVNLPQRIFGSDNTTAIFQNWLHTTAESFTPPSRSMTMVDIPGMGGLGSSFLAGSEVTRTFTVAFREYQSLPIYRTLKQWTSFLDPNMGISPVGGLEYIPANYKGEGFALLMKPTAGFHLNSPGSGSTEFFNEALAKNIEELFYFDGIYPETLPMDSFNSDIASNESLQLSVTFRFDGFPLGLEFMESDKIFKTKIENLLNNIIARDGSFDKTVFSQMNSVGDNGAKLWGETFE